MNHLVCCQCHDSLGPLATYLRLPAALWKRFRVPYSQACPPAPRGPPIATRRGRLPWPSGGDLRPGLSCPTRLPVVQAGQNGLTPSLWRTLLQPPEPTSRRTRTRDCPQSGPRNWRVTSRARLRLGSFLDHESASTGHGIGAAQRPEIDRGLSAGERAQNQNQCHLIWL
jgi:hypothetical protein